ncbi:MAG: RDD family protein [Pseudomonadota bacterium]
MDELRKQEIADYLEGREEGQDHAHDYAGFWIRVWATFIDSFLLLLVSIPVLVAVYGTVYLERYGNPQASQQPLGVWEILISYILPIVAVIAFWLAKSATPGKMLCKLMIVDAKTGGKPSTGQFIGRYCAYLVAFLPLCLGVIWVAFDPKKQGWHDKLSGTLVVKPLSGSTQSVRSSVNEALVNEESTYE